MQFNLKLSHKGLILVAVPLAFGLVFILSLIAVLNNAEHEVWKEKHHQAVASEVDSLVKNLVDSATALYMYSATDSRACLEQYERKSQQIPEQIRSLRTMVRDNPNQQEHLERIDRFANRGVLLLQEMSRLVSEDKPVAGTKEELGNILRDLWSEIGKFMQAQRNAFTLDPQASAKARLMVVQCLWLGIAGNIVLAVALAVFFNRSAARRLAVLVDNTDRLARGDKLNPIVPGGDEIRHLDQVFHNMAERLAEAARRKQEMIAMVSHDLKTPLTSIQASLTLLSEGVLGSMPEAAGKEVQIAENNTTRLIDLINDLLDIEKLEAGQLKIHPSDIPLARVFERSLESVGTLAEKQGIKIAVPAADLKVHADSDRLVQVIVNLLSNAIKFSPSGSTISIIASAMAGSLEVRVVDQGRGVPDQYKQMIFERFQQVELSDSQKRKGTGLGLPICKAIIEGHGGTIGVESEEGKGSTFWFRVPAAGVGSVVSS